MAIPSAPSSDVSLNSYPIITSLLHFLVVAGGAALTAFNFGWAADLLGTAVALGGSALGAIHLNTTSEAAKILAGLSAGVTPNAGP